MLCRLCIFGYYFYLNHANLIINYQDINQSAKECLLFFDLFRICFVPEGVGFGTLGHVDLSQVND